VTGFGPYEMTDAPIDGPEPLRSMRVRWPVLWVDAAGLEDEAGIERIGVELELHPAGIDAVLEPAATAACLRLDDQTLLVLAAPPLERGAAPRRMGLFVAGSTVALFRDRGFPPPDRRRETLREDVHLRRGTPADLATALVSDALDAFEGPVADAERRLAALEGRVRNGDASATAEPLHTLRRELLELRRIVRPLAGALESFAGGLAAAGGDRAAEALLEQSARAASLLDRAGDEQVLAASLADLGRAADAREHRRLLRLVLAFAAALLPLAFIAAFPAVLTAVPPADWARWTAGLAAAGAAALVALALASRR
jgi:magnesium transporter